MTANGNGARTTANHRMVRTHVLRFPSTLVGPRHVWKPNINAAVIARSYCYAQAVPKTSSHTRQKGTITTP
jgi:hypothetical protein